MKKLLLLLLPLLSLSACAANKVGFEGHQQFLQNSNVESVNSQKSYADFARCFEQNAKLYPMTEVKYISERNEAVYELAGYGWWFETITFMPSENGSVAKIRLANNYDQKWINDFRKDRYPAVIACK